MSDILVIKLGALGDVVLATGAFRAIRDHHKGDRITLLTTEAFAGLLRESPYFDDAWIDNRPKFLFHPFAFLGLIRRIGNARFTRIYDLQCSERTNWYFRLLGSPRPEWVGTARGASHSYMPDREHLHTLDRQKEQLAIAGIDVLPQPDISWLKADISRFTLGARYALIAPGGSSHRPGKRWPASHYGTLCLWLVEHGITPVLIGTETEASVLSIIEAICPDVRNLRGQTNFADVAEMARHAAFAIGNDTGPMHLIAATGCASLVLFSQFSDPVRCAPRGNNVTVQHQAKLADLSPDPVTRWAERHLQH